jgi:hypothetical protein
VARRRVTEPRRSAGALACRAVDADEARALAIADPAVQAGWFDVVVDPWWIPAHEVTLGNRVDLTIED